MNNIVSLLTEEPQKLERMFLLFLKLLVVLFIGGEVFGYEFSMNEDESFFPKDFTISQGIFFLISLTIVWYVIWELIADALIGWLTIWIFSRKAVKRDTFMEILDWFGVVKQKGKGRGKYIVPDKRLILFFEMLENFSAEDAKIIDDGKNRIQGYLSMSVIIYCVLLIAPDIELPRVLVYFGGFMILNMLVLAVLINKAHRYLIDNFDELKKELGFMAYAHMTKNALEQNQHIARNFDISGRWKALHVTRKNTYIDLPEEIRVHPVYIWNEEYGKEVIEDMIAVRCRENDRFRDKNVLFILISNTQISATAQSMVDANPKLEYIQAEVDEERIYKKLEHLFYRLSKRSRMIVSPRN